MLGHVYSQLEAQADLDLKRLLASSCRQKILRELSISKQMRIMHLVHKINGTYLEINRNLKILENEGIIINEVHKQVRHGNIRLVVLKADNPRTKILIDVIKMLEAEDNGNNLKTAMYVHKKSSAH
jgi:predicted transcriptional regulator